MSENGPFEARTEAEATRILSCPYCSAEHVEGSILAAEHMFGLGGEFEYLSCSECGSLRIAQAPDDLGPYYDNDYYSFADPGDGLRSRVGRFQTRFRSVLRADPIERLAQRGMAPKYLPWIIRTGVKPSSRILDVGCGSGDVLSNLVRLGFSGAEGFDPFYDGQAVSQPFPIWSSLVDAVGDYDLIMLNHSLEHDPCPEKLLKDAVDRLAHGGLVLVRIPLAKSWAAITYGPFWVQLDAPRHLSIPSLEGMLRFAQRLDLHVVKTVFDSTAFQFWGSEAYASGLDLGEAAAAWQRAGWSTRRSYSERARSLNASGLGDSACFYLEKA